MSKRFLQFAIVVVASVAIISCYSKNDVKDKNSQDEKPNRVLDLPVPKPRHELINGKRVDDLGESELLIELVSALRSENYELASLCQYWIVKTTKLGRYDLACYESRAGHIDDALYWLQEAAYFEGVGATHAETYDDDLINIRKDERQGHRTLTSSPCAR